jgi:hypothetical protein
MVVEVIHGRSMGQTTIPSQGGVDARPVSRAALRPEDGSKRTTAPKVRAASAHLSSRAMTVVSATDKATFRVFCRKSMHSC